MANESREKKGYPYVDSSYYPFYDASHYVDPTGLGDGTMDMDLYYPANYVAINRPKYQTRRPVMKIKKVPHRGHYQHSGHYHSGSRHVGHRHTKTTKAQYFVCLMLICLTLYLLYNFVVGHSSPHYNNFGSLGSLGNYSDSLYQYSPKTMVIDGSFPMYSLL